MGLYRALFSEKREREYSDRELLTRYAQRIVPFRKSVALISLFIFHQQILVYSPLKPPFFSVPDNKDRL